MQNTQDQNFLNMTINDRYVYFNFSSCVYIYRPQNNLMSLFVRNLGCQLTKNAANSNTHPIHGRIIKGTKTVHNQSGTAIFVKFHSLQYPVTAQCQQTVLLQLQT